MAKGKSGRLEKRGRRGGGFWGWKVAGLGVESRGCFKGYH